MSATAELSFRVDADANTIGVYVDEVLLGNLYCEENVWRAEVWVAEAFGLSDDPQGSSNAMDVMIQIMTGLRERATQELRLLAARAAAQRAYQEAYCDALQGMSGRPSDAKRT